MTDKVIDSFEELHRIVQKYSSNTAIFRGMKCVDYELIPSVGRMKFICPKPQKEPDPEREELIMFEKFKQRAIPYLEFNPADEWDWLTLAQHHGLPTRLLDWTLNPLVAAYFTVEDDFCNEDGVIYACLEIDRVNTKKHQDPFAVSFVGRFTPRHVTRRLTAQAGLFTVHPNPSEPVELTTKTDRLIIRKALRRTLKTILYRYGIHKASLFPDLDGLAGHIKWLREAW